MTHTVRVELESRSYEIIVGPGALELTADRLPERAASVACVTDTRVQQLHGEALRATLARGGVSPAAWCVAQRGERAKTLRQAERLCEALVAARVGRDGVLVCLGGGVVGDLGGFVAAIYQRGIPVVQVPTTLLAQVDASVGGKTGVNLRLGKNMVGAFHQPTAVLCDTLTLRTLGTRDLRSGLAEALKHGAIRDARYFDAVCERVTAALARDPDALAEIVVGSCRVKAGVVAADEREGGLRAILNYGHTVGHAIETVAGYGRYRHGEAVAIGMLAAARIGLRMGLCDSLPHDGMLAALRVAGLPTACPAMDPDLLLEAMGRDKKRLAGGLRWVLPTGLGTVAIVPDVPEALVREAIRDLAARSAD